MSNAEITAAGIVPSPSVVADWPRRLAMRHLWLIPGLGVALFANTQATNLAVGLVPLLVFGIVPHLTVLVGFGQPHARGQLAPRAVPLFNAMHQPLVPLAVLGLAVTGILSPFWLVGALAWLSHIVVDWGFDNGLRTADGYLRVPRVPKQGHVRSESDPWMRPDGSPAPADVLLGRGAWPQAPIDGSRRP